MTLWRKRQIKQSESRDDDDDAWEIGIQVMAAVGGVFLFMTIVALLII